MAMSFVMHGFLSVFKVRMKNEIGSRHIKTKKLETRIFITVVIMQLGFTLTIGRNKLNAFELDMLMLY